VIGLNVWDKGNTKPVRSFVKRHNISYPVLIDRKENVFKAYMWPAQPRSVPTNAVINKKGVITYLGGGFDPEAMWAAIYTALKE
jgi:peroxiredoxin